MKLVREWSIRCWFKFSPESSRSWSFGEVYFAVFLCVSDFTNRENRKVRKILFFSASNSFNYLHSTSKLFLLDGNLKRKGFIKFIGNNGELTSASAMSFLSQKRRKCVSEFVMRAERPFDTSPSLCWCGKVPSRFLKIELSCTVVISIR